MQCTADSRLNSLPIKLVNVTSTTLNAANAGMLLEYMQQMTTIIPLFISITILATEASTVGSQTSFTTLFHFPFFNYAIIIPSNIYVPV